MSVFVLDKNKHPLMPCSEKRARLLLERKRARVVKRYPFTIRLIDRKIKNSSLQMVCIKIDPGSKTTGIAVVLEKNENIDVLFLAELIHRGQQISKKLAHRASMRRKRRSRLRYRPARFSNRAKPKGWIAPSLRHLVESTVLWIEKLQSITPVSKISMELVRFDTQKMENPEISGTEYQHGTLAGYEAREYLLNKWNRSCAYCGAVNTPLNIDHIYPKSRGGSDRVSNLTIACVPCNTSKDAYLIEEFLANKPEILSKILKQAKRPFKDAAAINSTRWSLFNTLKKTGIPLKTGSGGQTKWNRYCFGIPKSHSLDAVCVGEVKSVSKWNVPRLLVKATGRGNYQRTQLNSYGFPRGYLMRTKCVFGFKTGDMVRAIVPKGKNIGTHTGRVSIRSTGSFNIQLNGNRLQNISHKYCVMVSRADGYGYSFCASSK